MFLDLQRDSIMGCEAKLNDVDSDVSLKGGKIGGVAGGEGWDTRVGGP